MRLTRNSLRRIIKEELEKALFEQKPPGATERNPVTFDTDGAKIAAAEGLERTLGDALIGVDDAAIKKFGRATPIEVTLQLGDDGSPRVVGGFVYPDGTRASSMALAGSALAMDIEDYLSAGGNTMLRFKHLGPQSGESLSSAAAAAAIGELLRVAGPIQVGSSMHNLDDVQALEDLLAAGEAARKDPQSFFDSF